MTAKPCPLCGATTLSLTERLIPRPMGQWSLSGMQTRVSATAHPHLSCLSCGMSVTGVYRDGDAVFNPEDVTYE